MLVFLILCCGLVADWGAPVYYTIDMKYPSVFVAVAVVWIVIDVLAAVFGQTNLTYTLYFCALIFSLVLFLIGFWRNK